MKLTLSHLFSNLEKESHSQIDVLLEWNNLSCPNILLRLSPMLLRHSSFYDPVEIVRPFN